MPAQTTLAPSEQTTGQDDLAAVLERLSLTLELGKVLAYFNGRPTWPSGWSAAATRPRTRGR